MDFSTRGLDFLNNMAAEVPGRSDSRMRGARSYAFDEYCNSFFGGDIKVMVAEKKKGSSPFIIFLCNHKVNSRMTLWMLII